MLLTVVWVVIVINAVNLVDGLDGLAAGMVAIAAAAFFIYMVRTPSSSATLARPPCSRRSRSGSASASCPGTSTRPRSSWATRGRCCSACCSRSPRSPAWGATPTRPAAATSPRSPAPCWCRCSCCSIPFLDVVLAVVRRTWRRQGIGQADKEHIHHRLMDIGHTPPHAVLLMYLWSALISASALAVGLIDGRLAVGAILLVARRCCSVAHRAPAAGAASAARAEPDRRGSTTPGPRRPGPTTVALTPRLSPPLVRSVQVVDDGFSDRGVPDRRYG